MQSSVKAYVWDITGGFCWYCGDQMHPFRTFSVDHIEPVSQGGKTEEGNLVPCCRWCNVSKSNRSIESLRRSLANRFGVPSFEFAFARHPEWFENV